MGYDGSELGSQWDEDDVSDWLEQLGFKVFISRFVNSIRL